MAALGVHAERGRELLASDFVARTPAVGVAGGLVAAVALGRLLESQLFGVGPAEPRVRLAAALLLTTAGVLAIWWPARRAARMEPSPLLNQAC